MSKVKVTVTAAQRKVLEQMAAGETITKMHDMGRYGKASAWLDKSHDKVHINTLVALDNAKLIKRTGLHPGYSEYRITPEGRAIVQAKEAAGEG